jgi:hypothetical protein
MELTTTFPSQVYAGQLFSATFQVKDYFGNVMKGPLNIQIFANVSAGLSFVGVQTQQVGQDGTATFESVGKLSNDTRDLTVL